MVDQSASPFYAGGGFYVIKAMLRAEPRITEATLRDTVLAGGFTQFRRATQTPFNRVFEARR